MAIITDRLDRAALDRLCRERDFLRSLRLALHEGEPGFVVARPPHRLPHTVRVTHRFTDTFTLVAAPAAAAEFEMHVKRRASRVAWTNRQNWLVLDESANTGRRLKSWMAREGCRTPPGMQLPSFDLIINLVALGMGVSFVPVRALALYSGKRTLLRLRWPTRFVRELVVVVRRNRKLPEHLAQFVENVLF